MEQASSLSVMDAPYDWNELDKAVYAMRRSKAALPNLMRALTQGDLCALMPYHPELEGQVIKIQNGSPFNFVQIKDEEGEAVLLFSSEARADEGMKKGGVADNTFCVATLNARQMLEIMGAMKMRAILNRSCATGTMSLPFDMMRDLANGVALNPPPGSAPHETVERTLKIVEPADYPTNLIQPLFETLRSDRKFRAAWVLRDPEPNAAGGSHYQMLVWMEPRDEGLSHDFDIVLQNSCQKPDEASCGLIDEKDDAYVQYLFDHAHPFYTAPDCAQARPLVG